MDTYNPQQSFQYQTGAYGSQVPQVNLPNPSAALAAQFPGVSGLNNQLSGLIGSELSGDVSPTTMQLLSNAGAARGIALGQPNSPISNEMGLNLLGTTSEGQQQAGVNNYNQTIPTVTSTQTLNPALEMEGNLQNAVSASSPVPAAAASAELGLLQQYMAELNPPSGGGGTYTTQPNPYSEFGALSAPSGGTGTFGGGGPIGQPTYNPYQVFNIGGGSSGGSTGDIYQYLYGS